jgi:hypothetical protein
MHAEDQSALPAGVARELRALRRQWQQAYIFSVHRGGIWRATRVDDGQMVEADSAAGLGAGVAADHAARPVVIPEQRS